MPQIRERDVGRLAEVAAAQERLEEARRLVDAQLDGRHDAVPDAHVHARPRPRRARACSCGSCACGRVSGWLMRIALLPELGTGRVERAEDVVQLPFGRAETLAPAREGGRVRGLLGPEAAVAAAIVRRADRPAPGVRDRPEAGRPVRDHDADVAAPLALDADALRRDARLPPVQERAQHLEQLALVDRAPLQLEVDAHVRRDRSRRGQRRDVGRRRVHDREEVVDGREVAQRLDAARGGAGADRDQRARCTPDLLDALGIVRGRDRALDQREVVGPADGPARGLEEVGDLDLAGDLQQLVLAVEQGELAAVARGELPDGEPRLARHAAQSSRASRRAATRSCGSTGPSRQSSSGPS